MKKKIIIARLTEILGVGNFTNEDVENAMNSEFEDLEELFSTVEDFYLYEALLKI